MSTFGTCFLTVFVLVFFYVLIYFAIVLIFLLMHCWFLLSHVQLKWFLETTKKKKNSAQRIYYTEYRFFCLSYGILNWSFFHQYSHLYIIFIFGVCNTAVGLIHSSAFCQYVLIMLPTWCCLIVNFDLYNLLQSSQTKVSKRNDESPCKRDNVRDWRKTLFCQNIWFLNLLCNSIYTDFRII